jgi:uncharacterized protein YpmB
MNRKILLGIIIALALLIIFLIAIVFMAKKNMALEEDFKKETLSLPTTQSYLEIVNLNTLKKKEKVIFNSLY